MLDAQARSGGSLLRGLECGCRKRGDHRRVQVFFVALSVSAADGRDGGGNDDHRQQTLSPSSPPAGSAAGARAAGQGWDGKGKARVIVEPKRAASNQKKSEREKR